MPLLTIIYIVILIAGILIVLLLINWVNLSKLARIKNENKRKASGESPDSGILGNITKQEEVDRLKSSFVANVTHELRTPLVSIDKAITFLLSDTESALSKKQQQFLSIASRNCKRLSLLINDLLDLSKLEAGKMNIKLTACFIDKVIGESVEGLHAWANAKPVVIVSKVQANLPQVKIDPDKINQVLNNLIGNAIKFTPNNGAITVEAKLHNDREVVVSVQDTGAGIAKHELLKVFDKFYQADEKVVTDASGTGIGLSIAKEIVQLHGGKIWAQSDNRQGAKFSFTIPINLSESGRIKKEIN